MHRSCGKIVRKVGWSNNTPDKIWDWNGNFHLNCGKFYNKMIAESMTGWIDFATNLGKVTNSRISITTRMATYAMSVISFTKTGMRKGLLGSPNLMKTVVKFTTLPVQSKFYYTFNQLTYGKVICHTSSLLSHI